MLVECLRRDRTEILEGVYSCTELHLRDWSIIFRCLYVTQILPCSESQNVIQIGFCSLSLLISAMRHTKTHWVITPICGSSDELFSHSPHWTHLRAYEPGSGFIEKQMKSGQQLLLYKSQNYSFHPRCINFFYLLYIRHTSSQILGAVSRSCSWQNNIGCLTIFDGYKLPTSFFFLLPSSCLLA